MGSGRTEFAKTYVWAMLGYKVFFLFFVVQLVDNGEHQDVDKISTNKMLKGVILLGRRTPQRMEIE